MVTRLDYEIKVSGSNSRAAEPIPSAGPDSTFGNRSVSKKVITSKLFTCIHKCFALIIINSRNIIYLSEKIVEVVYSVVTHCH